VSEELVMVGRDPREKAREDRADWADSSRLSGSHLPTSTMTQRCKFWTPENDLHLDRSLETREGIHTIKPGLQILSGGDDLGDCCLLTFRLLPLSSSFVLSLRSTSSPKPNLAQVHLKLISPRFSSRARHARFFA